jgi:Flp pilus assembly protein TadD
MRWALFLLALPACAVPSSVCGGCHRDIYRKYMQTPMARTSGVVPQVPHFEAAAGQFQVAQDAAGLSFRFAFEGEEIRRKLDYFIGAGLTGRSYITNIDGFLFQAPVSYYESTKGWDLSPGYEKSATVNLTREVEPSCLNCHASGVRMGSDPPFEEAGISCERCHGSGAAHVSAKHAKMPPVQRDTACAQCHLLGVVTIAKTVFVWDGAGVEATVNGHLEQLARSRCARESGGKLWCGSCHDPHTSARVTAQSCQPCHAAAHRQKEDCLPCHMPSRAARTVQHASLTDHTIPRVASPPPQDVPADARLIAFGGAPASDRDLGLAYASLALRDNNRTQGMRAIALLQNADPSDFKALTQLAQLLERAGQQQRACDLYARAVALDPAPIAAAVNLGSCLASQGQIEKAIPLWRAALSRNPALESARLNLGVALYRAGDAPAARAAFLEGLRFNPASTRLRALLKEIR